jgi:2-phosphoglycerate kinase
MKRLILIGGGSGVGKTTTGRQLSRKLDADWLQLDSLWIAIREALPFDNPDRSALYFNEALAEDSPIDALVRRQIRGAEVIGRTLPAVLQLHFDDTDVVVCDGVWLLPSSVAHLNIGRANIEPVFIHEADYDALASCLEARDGPSQTPAAGFAKFAWHYGNYLCAEAQKYMLPVVEARPWETLLDRVEAALV